MTGDAFHKVDVDEHVEKAARIPNGFLTIESPNGGHRTFRIATKPFKARAGVKPGDVVAPQDMRVLELLVGPDNGTAYKGFAFVDDRGIHVWKRFRSTNLVITGSGVGFSVHAAKTYPGWSDHEKFAWMLWDLAVRGDDGEMARRGYRLLVDTRCMICNRRLTTPESIDSGIGPICAGRNR